MRGIDRDAQDLGIVPGEALEILIEPGNLAASNAGECERIKDNDDVALPALIRQPPLRPKMAV